MSKKGIDVSDHQGIINWKKVKNAGIEFAMLRAGYGKNNIDAHFKRNAVKCNQLGIPIGAYWFSYAYTVNMAKKEADYCIAALKKYKITYPVCYDFEYDSVNYAKKKGVSVDKALATKMAKAFCAKIKKAGYVPMNYTNLDYRKNMFGKIPYDIWLAAYNKLPAHSNITMWQYTSHGVVAGISGNVDMDICYKNFKREKRLTKKKNPYPKPTKLMRLGNAGARVRWIQFQLVRKGYLIAIDGYFGNKTEKAVRKFQKKHGLAADGIVGPKTIAKLEA